MGYICTVFGEGSSKYNRAVCKLCMCNKFELEFGSEMPFMS